jgi:hypothetical protein
MVLLVLKLFVSSHPFKLWRCPMHLCFLFHEGQAEYHFAMFSLCSKQTKWFSMHYYSWSFVSVTFHVVTWLLSSMVRIISLMPMFRVLWSQLAMLYIDLIKIVLATCHLKNYYFCYHLPTRERAAVKLGDAWYVANISIIFDAPCLFYTNYFMFCLHFVAFLCIFWN